VYVRRFNLNVRGPRHSVGLYLPISQLDAVPHPLSTPSRPFRPLRGLSTSLSMGRSRRQFPSSIYKRVQLKLQQIVAYWNLNCTDTERERAIVQGRGRAGQKETGRQSQLLGRVSTSFPLSPSRFWPFFVLLVVVLCQLLTLFGGCVVVAWFV